MPDDGVFFIKIFTIAIAVAFMIYRFQLIYLIISLFRKDYSKSRSEDILARYHRHEIKTNLTTLISPDFHKLKIVKSKNGNTIKYYFVNQGGDIFNMKLTSLGEFDVSVSPDKIMSNESGCLIFKFSNQNYDDGLIFKLFYTNREATPKEDIFCYSFKKETVKIMYN